MLKKLIDNALNQSNLSRQQDRLQALRQALIRHEAKVGGRVFGEIPKNHKRDFFCLDRHTWIWHEEWVDKNGDRHVVATRYDVRPGGHGVLKSQNGGHYQQASPEEVRRLHSAAHLYVDRVKSEVYNFAS